MAVNPKSKSNLKPFKKGPDPRRNLKGATPKIPGLEELLSKVLGEEKRGATGAEKVIIAMYKKAVRGNTKAAEILLERVYGKVKQEIGVDAQVTNITRTILTKTIEHKS